MTAATLVLEPIFEADVRPEQYAYRPGRNAQQAAVEVERPRSSNGLPGLPHFFARVSPSLGELTPSPFLKVDGRRPSNWGCLPVLFALLIRGRTYCHGARIARILERLWHSRFDGNSWTTNESR
jgi:hypothetical protein